MKDEKRLGIWMDHSSAHLVEATEGSSVSNKHLASDFDHQDKTETLHRGEHLMHNKEHHKQSEYYKAIGAVIRHYDHVLLFGPTSAKTELANMLKDDHLFAKIKIEVVPADKMPFDKQEHFVKEYFSQK